MEGDVQPYLVGSFLPEATGQHQNEPERSRVRGIGLKECRRVVESKNWYWPLIAGREFEVSAVYIPHVYGSVAPPPQPRPTKPLYRSVDVSF